MYHNFQLTLLGFLHILAVDVMQKPLSAEEPQPCSSVSSVSYGLLATSTGTSERNQLRQHRLRNLVDPMVRIFSNTVKD